ncbi:MAG TPA: hypothetical protein QF499_00355 [Gammaproteobacteria bacterium]|jgi:hypothetical protein|nr:hypothetical protein [Gammaproteobacteria bacterium]MDP7660313.1 hypothetical protein [Gammaproteobacteria bacterium]HJP37566.1 hypothetical protein [Gammaproteobacteria bacterium]
MRLTGYIFIVGSILFIIFQYVSEIMAVDMCLDSGQVYDYASSMCRSDIDALAYVSYAERFGLAALAAIIFAFAGCLLIAKARRSRN